MFAKIPDIININRNFLVPISFSNIRPNNNNANKLYSKCTKLPWRKIAVINLHGCIREKLFSKKRSVNPLINDCKINMIISAAAIHNV